MPPLRLLVLSPTLLMASLAGAALAAPADSAVLTMAANASGRPRECAGNSNSDRAWKPTIWDNARQPKLRKYCDLIGRAQAKLSQSPTAARDIATMADQELPGRAAPWVVRGRAEVALRRYPEALQAFDKARAIDERSVEEPASLRDLALAQLRTAKLQEAQKSYRALVPRLRLLSDISQRASVLLEASSVSMAASGDDGLRDAIALLSEARSLPANPYDPHVLALLGLALDRSGQPEQASGVLQVFERRALELPDPAGGSAPYAYLVDPVEAHAVHAMSLERKDPKRAIASWERYVSERKSGKDAEHAKRHIEALRKTKAPAKPGPR